MPKSTNRDHPWGQIRLELEHICIGRNPSLVLPLVVCPSEPRRHKSSCFSGVCQSGEQLESKPFLVGQPGSPHNSSTWHDGNRRPHVSLHSSDTVRLRSASPACLHLFCALNSSCIDQPLLGQYETGLASGIYCPRPESFERRQITPLEVLYRGYILCNDIV